MRLCNENNLPEGGNKAFRITERDCQLFLSDPTRQELCQEKCLVTTTILVLGPAKKKKTRKESDISGTS